MNGGIDLSLGVAAAIVFSRAPVEAVEGDGQLAARAAAGDLAAFEKLFHAHQSRVYGLCLRMTANPSRAEDLTQEAFVRAWEKLDGFRGDSAFGTWLHRLAVNLVVSHLRAHARRPPETELAPEPPSHTTTVADPGGGLDLERAIATLPDRARAVFVLHDVEGYRHAEIAVALGIAEGTSKAHLHRARAQLREALRR